MASQEVPIIDSHIHLYPEAEIPTLAWCEPSHALAKRTSPEEYRAATGSPANLRGFVFVETDRRNDGGREWKHALEEIEWLRRIAEGKPRDGEGHSAADADLCVGIVPWAPLTLGAEKLGEYLRAAEDAAGPLAWKKVRGFRLLLQDKPAGTGLEPEFIDALKLLGKRGFVFDLGVDQHRRGRSQLDEAVELIARAREGVPENERLNFVINHCCKPNLEIISQTDPSFVAWRAAMFTLAKCDGVYMKLSGLFSEMPDSLRARSPAEIFFAVQPWLAVVLGAFGPSRLMFGSDWPVCTVGVDDGDSGGAWKKWKAVVDRLCDMASLSEDDQRMLWGGTAIQAYGLDI